MRGQPDMSNHFSAHNYFKIAPPGFLVSQHRRRSVMVIENVEVPFDRTTRQNGLRTSGCARTSPSPTAFPFPTAFPRSLRAQIHDGCNTGCKFKELSGAERAAERSSWYLFGKVSQKSLRRISRIRRGSGTPCSIGDMRFLLKNA